MSLPRRRLLLLAASVPLALTLNGAGAAEAPAWTTPAVSGPGIRQEIYESAAAGAPVSYHLFLPPAYEAEPERRFPMLVWLHGSGGGEAGIRPVAAHFAGLMARKVIPPFLVLFPNGLEEGMWTDSRDGRTPVETIVIGEILPAVDQTFRTLATREGRAVEGFSMGGFGAARFGFKHPQLFSGVSMLGAGPLMQVLDPAIGPPSRAGARARILAEVYGGEQAYFQAESPWVLAERHAEELRGATIIRMGIGARDFTRADNETFHAHLEALGLPHAFVVVPDTGHEPMKVLRAMDPAFYVALFGAP